MQPIEQFKNGINIAVRLYIGNAQLRDVVNSSHFRNVLNALLEMYPSLIQLPTLSTPLSSKIADSPEYFPYFKDYIGALDGCHVSVHIPTAISAVWRDR
jgi:hypothetical protein